MRPKKVLIIVNKIVDHSGPTKSLMIYNHLAAFNYKAFDISVFSLMHSELCSDFLSQLHPSISFFNPKPGLYGLFKNFFLFLRYIFSSHYDIIQSHLVAANSFCLLCKLFGARTNLICTIHNKENYMRGLEENFLYKILGCIETRLAFLAELYICVSPSLQEYVSLRLQKYCFGSIKSISIFNCYDSKRFGKPITFLLPNFKESYSIPSSALIFGTMGLLIPRKNQMCSIKLLSMLRKVGVDIHLIILGDGPDFKKLEDFSYFLGVERYTHFLGHKSDIESYLPFFDFYFHPSLAEGFGLAVLEALMSSVPCITSNTEGLKDVMTSKTGFVVDINNEDDIFNAALALCDDLELRKYFSLNSRLACIQRFSPHVISSQYSSIFESILFSS